MQSIHVPASVVQKIGRVFSWLPSTLVLGAIVGGYRWIGSRASIDYVGERIGPAVTAAAAAQSSALSAESLAKDNALRISAAWSRIIEQHADLQVLREYSRDPSRGDYIGRARAYYAERFAAALKDAPRDPAAAYAAATLTPWRPDR